MSRFTKSARLGAVVTAVTWLIASSVASAGASTHHPTPVGPAQSFVGLVNGQRVNAGLTEACTLDGSSAGLLGGQTLEVLLVGKSTPRPGHTGKGSTEIEAVLTYTQGNVTSAVLLRKFSLYGVVKSVPLISVPCGGTGKITFSPNGSGAGNRPYSVAVTFNNVSASAG